MVLPNQNRVVNYGQQDCACIQLLNCDSREAVAELLPGLLTVTTTSSLKFPMGDYIFISKLNNSKEPGH